MECFFVALQSSHTKSLSMSSLRDSQLPNILHQTWKEVGAVAPCLSEALNPTAKSF